MCRWSFGCLPVLFPFFLFLIFDRTRGTYHPAPAGASVTAHICPFEVGAEPILTVHDLIHPVTHVGVASEYALCLLAAVPATADE